MIKKLYQPSTIISSNSYSDKNKHKMHRVSTSPTFKSINFTNSKGIENYHKCQNQFFNTNEASKYTWINNSTMHKLITLSDWKTKKIELFHPPATIMNNNQSKTPKVNQSLYFSLMKFLWKRKKKIVSCKDYL